MKDPFTLRLRWSRMLCDDVRHMAFGRADGNEMEFTPGQFLQIHFDWEGSRIRRSYSIASVPGRSEDVEIAVAYVKNGPATALLSGLGPGDGIETTGPFGRFCLQPDEKPARYVLVATGTGVTPYRAMIPEMTRRIAEDGTRFVLIQGARRPAELLYGEEFDALAGEQPGFEYHARYSRVQPPAPQAFEYPGHVQDSFEQLALDPDADIVYLCGNPNMIDDSMNLLRERGFGPRNLRREKYVSNR